VSAHRAGPWSTDLEPAAAQAVSIPRRAANRWIAPALDFAASLAGFGGALMLSLLLQDFLLIAFDAAPAVREAIAPLFLFWIAPRLIAREEPATFWAIFGERLCLGLGLIFIGQAAMQYAIHAAPAPLPLLVFGATLSSVFTAILRIWVLSRFARFRPGVLLIGADPTALDVARAMRGPILGVLAPEDAEVPAGMPRLGSVDDASLDAAIARALPSRLVVSDRQWAHSISPRRLVELRQAGIAVRDVADEYERVFSRVLSERLRLHDLLFSREFQAKRHTMALQAVYSNLLGLALLGVMSPLLILSALILLVAGHRPVLERVTCAGFQGVPFERLYFRTRRKDGSLSWAGHVVQALRLRGLPQIFNVLRGEMALIGPRPVRAVFVDHLNQSMAFHPHRFTVRPGLAGWAQVNLRGSLNGPAEPASLEYDLYYIKNHSLALDLEILLRTALPGLR
jgi:lipopolysaccharide/colanic/teichoic acid biosynthesis glycosyltransferase